MCLAIVREVLHHRNANLDEFDVAPAAKKVTDIKIGSPDRVSAGVGLFCVVPASACRRNTPPTLQHGKESRRFYRTHFKPMTE